MDEFLIQPICQTLQCSPRRGGEPDTQQLREGDRSFHSGIVAGEICHQHQVGLTEQCIPGFDRAAVAGDQLGGFLGSALISLIEPGEYFPNIRYVDMLSSPLFGPSIHLISALKVRAAFSRGDLTGI